MSGPFRALRRRSADEPQMPFRPVPGDHVGTHRGSTGRPVGAQRRVRQVDGPAVGVEVALCGGERPVSGDLPPRSSRGSGPHAMGPSRDCTLLHLAESLSEVIWRANSQSTGLRTAYVTSAQLMLSVLTGGAGVSAESSAARRGMAHMAMAPSSAGMAKA